MKQQFFIFFIMVLTYTIQSMDIPHQTIKRCRRIYKHSPGTYTRKFSPHGTTLYISKESRNNRIEIPLSEEMQKLCREHTPQQITVKDTDDSNNTKLCNKE